MGELMLCLLLAQAPSYAPAGLVNAASNAPGSLAPNTLATLYGKNLSFATRAVTPEDMRGNVLPTRLPQAGVTVLVDGIAAGLYFVSPEQVNFLIPANLRGGSRRLILNRDGVTGPEVELRLQDEAPELFADGQRFAAATRPDGGIVGAETPVRAGETIVLYATGLGRTAPEAIAGQIATGIAPLVNAAAFRLYVNGEPLETGRVFYVGLTPGFGGLYQINVRLPASLPTDPELRIGFATPLSQPGVRLRVKP
jgi:uncharacterized protein (TIGR03437 family)